MQDSPAQADEPPVTSFPTDPQRIHLQMPVDVRNVSLGVIAVLAIVYTLYWAQAVFIPLLLGMVFSYALSPAVDRLQRWRIPRALGITLVMVAVFGSIAGTAWALADDATALVESLPEAAQKLRRTVRKTQGSTESPIDKVQRAATNLEQAAAESSQAAPAPDRGVTRVQIEKPKFNIKDYLLSGTLGLASLAAQFIVVCFFVFFMVASGNNFRRKMVRIAGPRLSQKKITLQVLDEINLQIQRYLMVQIYTSVLVGLATGIAVWLLGLERAAVWGVLAGVLNLIPYIGSAVLAAALGMAGFMQFGTLGPAVQLAGASIAIHILSGNLVAPLLTSRVCRIDPVVIFIGVLAWGWLWGMWGLLLGAPILMAIKTVCDRVEDLKPIGELLGP
ncbi:MAG: AI-2E family transporter [Ideonella sp.]